MCFFHYLNIILGSWFIKDIFKGGMKIYRVFGTLLKEMFSYVRKVTERFWNAKIASILRMKNNIMGIFIWSVFLYVVFTPYLKKTGTTYRENVLLLKMWIRYEITDKICLQLKVRFQIDCWKNKWVRSFQLFWLNFSFQWNWFKKMFLCLCVYCCLALC